MSEAILVPKSAGLRKKLFPPPPDHPLFSNLSLKKLIVPLVIEQILAITVGMADTRMVSCAGEAAVSGVSLVDMINVLLINIFAALATGGAVVTSQFIGAQDRKGACRSGMQLLLVSFGASLLIMGLTLAFQRPLLQLLFGSITPEVMDNCLTYLWLSAISYPFLALYNACAALFRAMGNSKVSMYTSAFMNALNILGNAICVMGLGMGVAGVALPSLISRGVAAGVMLALLRNPSHLVTLRGQSFRPDFWMIRKILHIGIPNGLENGLFQLGRVLVVSIISVFGTAQIAANAVANNLDALGCIPGQAMSLAVITVIGQCIGAQDYKQATYYTKKLLKLSYLMGAVCNGLILLLLPWLLNIYNISAAAQELAFLLVWIHDGLAIFLWPAAFILPNALRAANDVRFTMVISIFSMWAFRILLSYIVALGFQWGAVGVWLAMVVDWVFRIILFVWRFTSGKWKLHKSLASS